jgi:hypothetical protein
MRNVRQTTTPVPPLCFLFLPSPTNLRHCRPPWWSASPTPTPSSRYLPTPLSAIYSSDPGVPLGFRTPCVLCPFTSPPSEPRPNGAFPQWMAVYNLPVPRIRIPWTLSPQPSRPSLRPRPSALFVPMHRSSSPPGRFTLTFRKALVARGLWDHTCPPLTAFAT